MGLSLTRRLFTPLATLLVALVAAALPAGLRPASAQLFQGEQTMPGQEVVVTLTPSKQRVSPGEQFAIAVVFDFAPTWHAWPDQTPPMPRELEGFSPIPSLVEVVNRPPAVSRVGPAQWPEPSRVLVAFGTAPVEILSFKDRTVAYLPLILAADAPAGPLTIDVRVRYQACDETVCLQPVDEVRKVTVEVVPLGTATEAGANADPALFQNFDLTVFARMLEQRETAEINVFGWKFRVQSAGVLGTLTLLFFAAVGGLLLNLTPCVLPVIPIKIMGLSQSAGNPSRALFLGVVMSLGVIAFWLALGGAIAFISGFDAISSLFQRPWFVIGAGAVIAVMGVGMLGLFTVSLPKAVYMVNPSHDTVHGSFLFGVMTAILSTPCTAPFMGSAAAWATQQPAAITMLTFASIGLGMALPYLLLSANPRWVAKVPRTGPASELVKQVMGLLMLAVAAFFLGIGLVGVTTSPPDPPSKQYWWAVAFFVTLAGGWLIYKTFRITKKPVRRAVFAAFGLALVAAAVAAATSFTKKGPIDWVYYTPDRFAQAIDRGDVVVLDFTAEWCLNCKALESAVLNRPDIARLVQSPGVTPMKIDLTGDNPDGRAKLKELGWAGIPLLAIFGPGAPEPILYDSYTPETVRSAVGRAKGADPAPGASPAATPPAPVPASPAPAPPTTGG